MIRCIFAFALATAICLDINAVAAEPQLAHMVYFKLKESTGNNKERLVVACKKYLQAMKEPLTSRSVSWRKT